MARCNLSTTSLTSYTNLLAKCADNMNQPVTEDSSFWMPAIRNLTSPMSNSDNVLLRRKPMSLFDSLRLERASALSCDPHQLQVKVLVEGEVALDLDKAGKDWVTLTGLTLTSASLVEGKMGEVEERNYLVALPPIHICFDIKKVGNMFCS